MQKIVQRHYQVLCLMLLLSFPGRSVGSDFIVPVSVGVVAGGALVGVYFGTDKPSECKWCASNRFDTKGSEALQWSHKHAADVTSDVMFCGVMPALALITALSNHQEGWQPKLYDGLLMLDAAILDMLTTIAIKRGVARERPYHSYNMTDYGDVEDAFVSFPSGHTSITFTLAAASAVMAFQQDSTKGVIILSFGTILSAFTGYLRIAAAKHWPSDVLTGMGIGSLLGAVTPLLLLLGKSKVQEAEKSQA